MKNVVCTVLNSLCLYLYVESIEQNRWATTDFKSNHSHHPEKLFKILSEIETGSKLLWLLP